jgi:hypothetical protein
MLSEPPLPRFAHCLLEAKEMLRMTVLILMFLTASVEVTRTQSLVIRDATIQASAMNKDARAAGLQRSTRRRGPCDRKRRTLAGAGIGFVMGMIVVNRAAAENDGSVGATGTLYAGAYGAALGALIGVATCR